MQKSTLAHKADEAARLAEEGPLSRERERALKPKDSFKEGDNYPEMVVVPAGSFTMDRRRARRVGMTKRALITGITGQDGAYL